MKQFFGDRLVKAVLAVTGLIATVGGPVPTIPAKLSTFSSNGCSVFPEGSTYGCCFVHDIAYWGGGTASERRRADRALETCVADVTGTHIVGGVMYLAVSLFGLPGVPTRVEWGYGWNGSRQIGYNALTRDEQDQLDARKQEVCRTLTVDAATGRTMVDSTHWIRAVDAQQLCSAAGRK